MKNIHVLPTDKPSKLSILNSGKLNFGAEAMSSSNSKLQHIYITSDEEIKEDDWFTENGINTLLQWRINKWKMSYSFPSEMNDICKKIILTTDQDLIKDSVQAIDDEFLEWFVKNPSCEYVDVQKWASLAECGYSYHIIISKEKRKQTVEQYEQQGLEKYAYEFQQETPEEENCCTPIGQIKRYVDCVGCDRKPKQETLEEAALRLYPKFSHDPYNPLEDMLKDEREIFIEGAEWQAERMYSEEEVQLILSKLLTDIKNGNAGNSVEWFEQFKKKGGDQ
jgi:hypothetical protein